MNTDHEMVFEEKVSEEYAGMRLDVFLAARIEDASRSLLQKLIKNGDVYINGTCCKRRSRIVTTADTVRAVLPEPVETKLEPQDIPLDILYEDQDVVVVNKQTGLVVHPAPGHRDGTLVNALLYHCPDFQRSGASPERPGIVHRLDRDTSGILVVAKNQKAFIKLGEQVRAHRFDRRYLALVKGVFPENSGRIVAAVGRSLSDRKRMSVTGVRGREAVTRFHSLEAFGVASLVSLQLETGRTHQIRVHMRFAGHPVLGDKLYGISDFSSWDIPDFLKQALNRLDGQALHAERLGFIHPTTEEMLTFQVPPPPDFQAALDAFREWMRQTRVLLD